jgi:peptide/nickel transport system substrate-binding protein
LGYLSADVTEEIDGGAYAGDRDALIANASPEDLVATCEKVMASVVADDEAGTVTFNLAQPWAPLMGTLAGSWGHIIDMEWAVEQGDWDGSCETWQNFYSPGNEGDALNNVINGTGPFMLENWTPGEEYSLVSNENYWRTEETPLWEGGPYGPPALKRVVMQNVGEFGTRFAAFQAGDADYIEVGAPEESQVNALVGQLCDWETDECVPADTGGFLLKYDFLPDVAHDAIQFNFDIPADSQYIGSGQLDGNGIPTDFFTDINVRKALATCFDYDTFINEVLNGKAEQLNGPIIHDMLGYNEDGPYYNYDPEACAAYLEEAWGGVLPETGFRFQIAYNTGNTRRQVAAEILQAELAAIDPNYQIEIVSLPWPSYLAATQAGQVPVAVGGWQQDIPDPHNWVQPFMFGLYTDNMNVPEEITQPFLEMGTAAVLATDPAEREQIYFDMQQMYYDIALQAPLPQRQDFRFLQPWVKGYYYRPGSPSDVLWYGLSKE